MKPHHALKGVLIFLALVFAAAPARAQGPTFELTSSPTSANTSQSSAALGSVTLITVAAGTIIAPSGILLSYNATPMGSPTVSFNGMSCPSTTILSGNTVSINITTSCTLSVGASATVSNLGFNPSAFGVGTVTATATAAITEGGNAINFSPATATVATVTAVSAATLSPATVNFGDQVVGVPSSPQTLTLTNTGAVTITSIVASPSVFAQTNNCDGTLTAGSKCTISVIFTPSATGIVTGTVTVTDDATDSPQIVNLLGTGAAASTTAALSPTSLNFGNALVGSISMGQRVTVTNTGAATLDVTSVSATGDFGIQANTCGAAVSPGDKCTVTVNFLPTASGARSGSLAIADNVAGSPQVVTLGGNGMTQTVTHPPNIVPPVTYATGQEPASVAVGDFNDDGKVDLAVANQGGDTVSILLGRGDGTFEAGTPFGVGTAPVAVAVGDFNNDGILDLAVANSGSGNVSVLLGKGDGTFTTHVEYAVGGTPSGVMVGDFTGDGILDLAVTDAASQSVSILIGKGDGTFLAPLGSSTVSLATPAEVPRPDYSVSLASGDPNPLTTAGGDFNNDGKPDMAVTNFAGDVVSVYLGNGDGTFRKADDNATGAGPSAVTSGYFHGGKNLDMAVANSTAGTVSVLLGYGDGTFQAKVDYAVGKNPISVSAVPVTCDGRISLAVVNAGDPSLSILVGKGDGTFLPQVKVPLPPAALPSSLEAGYFSSTACKDLSLTDASLNQVDVLLSKPSPSGSHSLGADFDGDGKADMAVWRPSTGWWWIIPSSNPSAPMAVPWGTNGDIPVRGDFDGDGKTDMAVWRPSTGEWWIIPSSNPSAPIDVRWGTSGDIPVPGDYDGDGKTDMAVWRPSTGEWWIIPSSNPSAVIYAQWGTNGDIPVPGDYDGDGKTDMAVWRPSTGEWWIIPSSNPGAPIAVPWGTSGDMPVPGDYDGDGKTDMAIWRPSTGWWWIIPSSNPGAPMAMPWGTNGDVPVPGDYDGDGKTDMAIWRPSTGVWWIIPSGNPSARIAQPWGAPTDIPLNKPVGQ